MSKLLERTISELRKLPKGRQNKAAKRLQEYLDQDRSAPEHVSIDEAREAYANGDFLTLARWKRDLGLID